VRSVPLAGDLLSVQSSFSAGDAVAPEAKMTNETKTTGRRTLTGVVASDRMDKTVTVTVTRLVQDARVHKYIRRQKNYKAHDATNDCKIGDTVVIEESRPLSKTKRWVVVERRPAAE
jgi:small subunit ribosomal protein S17